MANPMGKLIGHKAAQTSVKYEGKIGSARKVTTHETGPSNVFMQPRKTVHEIYLSPPGVGPARQHKEVLQERAVRPGVKLAATGASVMATPALAVAGTHTVAARKRAKKAAHKAKTKAAETLNIGKSMDGYSAFGVYHGGTHA